jgi:hypothetical protein
VVGFKGGRSENLGPTRPSIARRSTVRPPKARSRSIFRDTVCSPPISEVVAFEHLRCLRKTWVSLVACVLRQAGQTGVILALAVLFAYLFLVALYESWTVPTHIGAHGQ